MIDETDVRAVINGIAFMTPFGDSFRSNNKHGSSTLHIDRDSVIALEPSHAWWRFSIVSA